MNLKDELIEGKGYHVYEKFVPNILISDIKAILKELHPVRASSSKKVYAEKDEIGKLEDISVWWSQTVEKYKPVEKIKRCPNGTKKYKPLGDGCYTDAQIENHKNEKKNKTVKKTKQPSEDVEEGWKSKMAGAALAAANLLGTPAQAADEPVKPIAIAYVMIDGEVRKYNLGDKFSNAKEAEKFISGVLDKQGLQGYQLEIKHGYPKKKEVKEGYGRYWCSTDKKWKTRKGPKQSRKS